MADDEDAPEDESDEQRQRRLSNAAMSQSQVDDAVDISGLGGRRR